MNWDRIEGKGWNNFIDKLNAHTVSFEPIVIILLLPILWRVW